MENSKQPISPIKELQEPSNVTRSGYIHNDYLGLTKREHFAGLAMQGVLSHKHQQTPTPNQAGDIAMYAIQIADELLKQLDETL